MKTLKPQTQDNIAFETPTWGNADSDTVTLKEVRDMNEFRMQDSV